MVRELERLGPDVADIHEYVTILARAFWLLHQRPKRKGLFSLFRRRRKYGVTEVHDDKALGFLASRLPETEVVLGSLPRALCGLVEHVLGKKKREVAPPDTAV